MMGLWRDKRVLHHRRMVGLHGLAEWVVSGRRAADRSWAEQIVEIVGNDWRWFVAGRLLAAEGASMQRDMESETGRWYEQESAKLERWAEDRRAALKALLDESEEAYKRAKKAAREAGTMPERLRLETEARKLDQKKDDALKDFEVSSREVRDQKNKLLDELGERVQQRLTSTRSEEHTSELQSH